MQKTSSILILLVLPLLVVQGCNKASMESLYALGDKEDPDNPRFRVVGSSQPQKATRSCANMVAFTRYCLGGNIDELLPIIEPFRQKTKGSISILDFREKHGYSTVTIFQGKILSVRKRNRPANWRTFNRVMAQLESQHGRGDDYSSFPGSAKTKKRRQTAIYNKKAQAHFNWEGSGWRLDLVWNNIQTIDVTFQDKELNNAYLAGRKQKKP
ncbi:hypothetical protein MNBD_GAMMA26-1987 [hydrothermal vent metagenome]|uniref:Lipoprotein n=1 Tax=hydrothermal vent metagenome TaxID=652676 RepID=A0A3B1BQM1_9ZZZZ